MVGLGDIGPCVNLLELNQLKLCQHYSYCQHSSSRNVEFLYANNVAKQQQQCPLSSHDVQDALCGSFSWGHMKCQLKPISVSLTALVMRIATATETWNLFVVVCLCLTVSHYSLSHNQLTDTGAIALARALERNKSPEELK